MNIIGMLILIYGLKSQAREKIVEYQEIIIRLQ